MASNGNKSEVHRFDRLRVKGFRRLADVAFELRPLTVMIGANGVGKTSVLDAVSLLSQAARGGLNAAIGEHSGLSAILTNGSSPSLHLGCSMNAGIHRHLQYDLQILPQGHAYRISEERLSLDRDSGTRISNYIEGKGASISYLDEKTKQGVRPTWQYDPLETALAQTPKNFDKQENFRQQLGSVAFYHALNVEPRSPVRLPQQMRPAPLPGKDGEHLVSCLYYLRETEHVRFEAIEDALSAAFPRFQRLDFPPVAAGTLALAWREKGLSNPLYMHQLSEGTLRFLWLATLLQSPALPAIVLIDEPEVSLHPELLSLLSDLMREASARSQIIVATHSDRLVRFLKPKEILTMDVGDNGATELTWADARDLKAWMEDYSLDELWSNGRLGARP
jgi:predicted ATPase